MSRRYLLVLQQWVEAEDEDNAKKWFIDNLKHIRTTHIDVLDAEEESEEEPTC